MGGRVGDGVDSTPEGCTAQARRGVAQCAQPTSGGKGGTGWLGAGIGLEDGDPGAAVGPHLAQ